MAILRCHPKVVYVGLQDFNSSEKNVVDLFAENRARRIAVCKQCEGVKQLTGSWTAFSMVSALICGTWLLFNDILQMEKLAAYMLSVTATILQNVSMLLQALAPHLESVRRLILSLLGDLLLHQDIGSMSWYQNLKVSLAALPQWTACDLGIISFMQTQSRATLGFCVDFLIRDSGSAMQVLEGFLQKCVFAVLWAVCLAFQFTCTAIASLGHRVQGILYVAISTGAPEMAIEEVRKAATVPVTGQSIQTYMPTTTLLELPLQLQPLVDKVLSFLVRVCSGLTLGMTIGSPQTLEKQCKEDLPMLDGKPSAYFFFGGLVEDIDLLEEMPSAVFSLCAGVSIAILIAAAVVQATSLWDASADSSKSNVRPRIFLTGSADRNGETSLEEPSSLAKSTFIRDRWAGSVSTFSDHERKTKRRSMATLQSRTRSLDSSDTLDPTSHLLSGAAIGKQLQSAGEDSCRDMRKPDLSLLHDRCCLSLSDQVVTFWIKYRFHNFGLPEPRQIIFGSAVCLPLHIIEGDEMLHDWLIKAEMIEEWSSLSAQPNTKVELVFHGTTERNGNLIMGQGFDSSMRKRQEFGPGEYTSIDPRVSLQYCEKESSSLIACLLVTRDESHGDARQIFPHPHQNTIRRSCLRHQLLPLAIVSCY